MPPAGFEPANPTSERLQNYDLDRAATVIGSQQNISSTKFLQAFCVLQGIHRFVLRVTEAE
jgi:hypothetical protein